MRATGGDVRVAGVARAGRLGNPAATVLEAALVAGRRPARDGAVAQREARARLALLAVIAHGVAVPLDQLIALRGLQVLTHHLDHQFRESHPRAPAQAR